MKLVYYRRRNRRIVEILMDYKAEIIKTVTIKTAVTELDLALSVMEKINPVKFDRLQYDKVVKQLVYEKELVELKYVINNRVKLLYFPKGTVISA